jgi:hypothetical protein
MCEGRDEHRDLRRLPAVSGGGASRAAARDCAAAAAIVAVVVVLVGLRQAWRALAPRPTAGDCAALVDRYMRDKSRERFPDLAEAELERMSRSDEAVGHRPHDVASCRQDLTAAQVSCGLGAPDVAALERCMQ